MAKRFGFFNSINGDRKYLATDLSQAFDVGISTGLKADNADNFKIVPNANMQVKMMPGGAMIFGHYLLDEEEEIINLDMADAELNRIDRIVLRYDKFERSIKSAVIKGTPALTPVAPAALRTNEQFDLVLADVYIGKAVTSTTTANITDMRESDLCGFIGVKGAVSRIDFDAHVNKIGTVIKEPLVITNEYFSPGNAGTNYINYNQITKLVEFNAFFARTTEMSGGAWYDVGIRLPYKPEAEFNFLGLREGSSNSALLEVIKCKITTDGFVWIIVSSNVITSQYKLHCVYYAK